MDIYEQVISTSVVERIKKTALRIYNELTIIRGFLVKVHHYSMRQGYITNVLECLDNKVEHQSGVKWMRKKLEILEIIHH